MRRVLAFILTWAVAVAFEVTDFPKDDRTTFAVWWFVAIISIAILVTGPKARAWLHKKRLKFPTLSTIVVAALGAVALAVPWWYLMVRQPTISTSVVTIHPTGAFPLTSGEWSTVARLTVTNTTPMPVYSVWIEFWSDTPGVTEGLIVEVDSNQHAPKMKLGSLEIGTDAIKLHMTEPTGRKILLLGFYEILPNTPRHITVSSRADVRSTGQAKVIKVSATPEMMFTQRAKSRSVQ